MEVRNIDQKADWEQFVLRFPPNNFLQSWQFGEFNQAMGDTPVYLGVWQGNDLIAAGLFIHTRARRGNYLACAAGPLVSPDADYKQVLGALLDHLRSNYRDAVFIRIRPDLRQSEQNLELFAELGFRPAMMHLHAERTWLLDLDSSEEELLAQMRKNTRYYVRRASKDGVTVRTSRDLADVSILYDLQRETVSRQHFVAFSLRYFEELFKAFTVDDQALMFIADYEGEPLAAAMINYYGDMAVYHYAASSSRHRKVPAAYLVLWEAIREARRRGCKYFNFWGVVGEEEEDHPWHGLSLFKRGFGGREEWYLHAQDHALNWCYQLVRWLEAYRKKRRGL